MVAPNLTCGPTAEHLRELLDYNPLTGVFTWRVTQGRGYKGSPAGSINTDGYVRIRIAGRTHQAHRLAWLHVHGHWPRHTIDHRDRDRANNVLTNLRDVPPATNSQNMKQLPSRSGHRGVVHTTYRAGWLGNSWHATVRIAGRQVHLGYFKDLATAALVAHDARAVFHPGYPATDAERGEAILRILDRESRRRTAGA